VLETAEIEFVKQWHGDARTKDGVSEAFGLASACLLKASEGKDNRSIVAEYLGRMNLRSSGDHGVSTFRMVQFDALFAKAAFDSDTDAMALLLSEVCPETVLGQTPMELELASHRMLPALLTARRQSTPENAERVKAVVHRAFGAVVPRDGLSADQYADACDQWLMNNGNYEVNFQYMWCRASGGECSAFRR
jgi:hypothetical protein